jgi:Putative restriction endonuclease
MRLQLFPARDQRPRLQWNKKCQLSQRNKKLVRCPCGTLKNSTNCRWMSVLLSYDSRRPFLHCREHHSQFHTKIKKLERTSASSSTSGFFRWEFKDGKAWIYELPHPAHDDAAGRVLNLISRWFDVVQNKCFTFGSSPRCDDNVGRTLSMEPDGAVCLKKHHPGPGRLAVDKDGNRFPNIIVEVAFHESEAHVQDKALKWLTLSNATYVSSRSLSSRSVARFGVMATEP